MKKTKVKNLNDLGGWLALFIFTLFVSIVLNIIVGFGDVVTIFNLQILIKGWAYVLAFLDVLYFGGLIAFIIYAIYSFLKLKPNAVFLGKLFLILIFTVNLISTSYVLSSGISVYDGSLRSFIESQLLFRSVIYSIIWFLYLSLSKRVETVFPKKNRRQKTFDKVFFGAILAIPIAIYIVAFGAIFANATPGVTGDAKAEAIAMVKSIKSTIQFPYKIGENVEWVDFTLEDSAVRYHYVLSNMTSNDVNSDENLRSFLVTTVCGNVDLKSFLDHGINVEYSYVFKNSAEEKLLSISKEDCVK